MFDILVRDIATTLEAATESVRNDFISQGADSVHISLLGYGEFLATVNDAHEFLYEWRGNTVTLISE